MKTGAVKDIFRMQASEMEYPFAVGLSARQFALSSWFTGTVQLIDRASLKSTMLHGFKAPYDAIPLDDGSVLVLEIATGSISRVGVAEPHAKTVVAEGLAGPVQMVLGRDGAVYVTEAAGKLTRIPLTGGAKTTIADNLALPEGLAETPWGTFIVAEAAAARLTEIEPTSGARRSVAAQLPIGMPAGPGMPPPYVVTGVAVGADGNVYFSANKNNAIYRIRPQR